jgi:hypothetical protein
MLTPLETIRLFAIPILGTMLMFVAQPLLFSGQWLRLSDVKVQTWINNHYMPMAAIVLNIKLPHKTPEAGARRASKWWLISIVPVLGTVLAIFLSRQGILAPKSSGDAILPLIVLFTIDIITIYWLTTATSTPGGARRLPPGSNLFNR